MTDRCALPSCRGDVDVVYLDHGVCQIHWDRLTAEDQPADALARALGISVAMATTEDCIMSEKNETTKKATKKTTKAAKAHKPKREKAPKQDLCVFALRMTAAERTKLHDTAGPGAATRFARAVLIAAANEDESAFRQALKSVREART